MRPHPQAPGGFTLLEALVALVIVSISLGVLFQVVSGSLRLGVRAQEAFTVREDARKMFLTVLPETVDWEDVYWGNASDDWQWSLEARPVALGESLRLAGLDSGRDLILFVFSFTDAATGRSVSISSYRRMDPTSAAFVLDRRNRNVSWEEHDRLMGELRR
jgi:prepilin-type N-terminal cleavage/methylation domain-containing protein